MEPQSNSMDVEELLAANRAAAGRTRWLFVIGGVIGLVVTIGVIGVAAWILGAAGKPEVTTTTKTTSTSIRAPTTVTTMTTIAFSGFACTSDLKISPTVKMADKGLCLDDTTFSDCVSDMPGLWPHTQEPVKNLRMFAAWKDPWGDVTVRKKSWDKLVKWIKNQNAQVFFGTLVTCDEDQDAKDWEATLALIKLVGAEHVSTVGFGNEMDVAWRQTTPKPTQACLNKLWADNGRFWTFIQKCQADLDEAGFQNAKLTSTWAMSVLGPPGSATPFKEDAQAKVNTLLTNAFKKYGSRWVWTFNIYAIWDGNLGLDKGSSTQCTDAINLAAGPYTEDLVASCRKRITMLTGNENDPFVIGEIGWSNPSPEGQSLLMKQCKDWTSSETFKRVYAHFLSWDLSVIDHAKQSKTYQKKFKGPDQAFYFTARDSLNDGSVEHFGLLNSCNKDNHAKCCVDAHCKLNLSNTPGIAPKLAKAVV